MPGASVAWVRLHRVPPDIRILIPGRAFFSSSSVRRPRLAATAAASKPAAPAPTTTTSQVSATSGDGRGDASGSGSAMKAGGVQKSDEGLRCWFDGTPWRQAWPYGRPPHRSPSAAGSPPEARPGDEPAHAVDEIIAQERSQECSGADA